MPFLTGRVTCTRFIVGATAPRTLGPIQIEALTANAVGKSRILAGDGSQCGWSAGDHALDLQFDLAKNIINNALCCDMRVDQVKVPSELLKAYCGVELKALAANNLSGIPSKRQKREAKQAARDRVEEEARDGRWLRRKAIPVMWDADRSEVLLASTSTNVIDRLLSLFRQTFGLQLLQVSAGERAADRIREMAKTPTPCSFVASQAGEVDWSLDESCHDYLGNEFLLWLWYYLENKTDVLKLSDDSEVAMMLSRALYLQCPRGQTGKDSISSDGPTRLPEALRAVQAGKLPRKVGMTLVRHDQQYELTLQAETLAISGAKLPAGDAVEERARLEERVTGVRHLLETLDLVYEAFLARRLGAEWERDLAGMKKWLTLDAKRGAA